MELQNNLEQSNQEKNIPAPPPLEIDIRTMETDIKSLQESGGEVSGTGKSSEYSSFEQPIKESQNISGYQGSEKSIFSPTSDILVQQAQKSGNLEGSKFIFMMLGILIGMIGLGLLGYYVIFPLIFGK